MPTALRRPGHASTVGMVTTAPGLAALDGELAAMPGTISAWCGPVGAPTPAFERSADATHYAASTMKIAILAALYRTPTLDRDVPVANDFASAQPGAPRFSTRPDGDPAVWDRLGGVASLRWLGRRMIVRSSNLATNIVLAHVGLPAVDEVLRRAGVARMRVRRGIDDAAAREAGLDNVVTARDLATLVADVCRSEPMLEVLLAQERREDLAAGFPDGTRIAFKNGWITGVRHAAGIVFPDDAPPYVIAVCTTTPADARGLVARIGAASWADRHSIGG